MIHQWSLSQQRRPSLFQCECSQLNWFFLFFLSWFHDIMLHSIEIKGPFTRVKHNNTKVFGFPLSVLKIVRLMDAKSRLINPFRRIDWWKSDKYTIVGTIVWTLLRNKDESLFKWLDSTNIENKIQTKRFQIHIHLLLKVLFYWDSHKVVIMTKLLC